MAEEYFNNPSERKSLKSYIIGFIAFLLIGSGVSLAVAPNSAVKGVSDQVTATLTLTLVPTATNTPTPTLTPSPTPTPMIFYSPKPTGFTPTSVPVSNTELSNDNYYTNVDGNEVHSPAYSESIPSGASAICGDGTYSFSQNSRGTCSHHGGVAQWL